jgi:hypothetical protein
MADKYPNPKCDEACYYHCTQGGTHLPECKKETMADKKLDINIVDATVNQKKYKRLYINQEKIGDFTTIDDLCDALEYHIISQNNER